MTIHSLFPTPIFHEFIDLEELEEIKKFINSHFNIPEHKDYFLQSTGDLHRKDIFQQLKSIIETKSAEFWNTIGYQNTKMNVTQMWANIMGGKGFINDHFHSNSLISAIFYVDVDKGSGGTSFTEPTAGLHRSISVNIEKHTEYTSHEFTVNAKNNLLILFPSYLNHYSQPNFSKDSKRITISCNLMPNDLGSDERLNRLQLEKIFV